MANPFFRFLLQEIRKLRHYSTERGSTNNIALRRTKIRRKSVKMLDSNRVLPYISREQVKPALNKIGTKVDVVYI